MMLLSWISFWVLLVASKRPFTAQDLVTTPRLGSVAPNAKGALYTTSHYDISSNTVSTQLSYISFDSNQNYQLGINAGSEPFWLTDSLVGILREVNGTTQIFYSIIDKDSKTVAIQHWIQLTHFPVSVSGVKFHKQSSLLIFVATVNKDGSLENGSKVVTFTSGVVYDELFVRHWDRYIEPERFSQLFSVKLKIDGSRVTITDTPVNLMKGTRLQTPVPPNGGFDDYDISPDGNEIAFVARVPNRSQAWSTNTDIYLVPSNGSSSPIPISSFNYGYDMHPKYSPDGSFIAWLQMPTPQYEADKNRIALYPRSFSLTPKARLLTDEEWDRSPQSITWVSDGLVITAEEIGRLKLFHVSLDGLALPIVEDGHNSQVQYVDKLGLVFVKNSMTAPSEIYTFTDKDKKVEKRTNVAAELLSNVDLLEPEDFWFEGSRGRQVHGFILKPVDFKKGEVYPLALLIHGGPESSWLDDWGLRWNQQIFASAGYVVVCINPTGSTGYGSQFTQDILNNWGNWPYKDLMAGLDYVLDEYSFIDAGRLAALGASYGGYMINWINGHTDRFSCLVNHDGIFDTTGSFYNTDELWFPESEFGGVAYAGRKKTTYKKYSPRKFVTRWKTPTLVIHSELDYRLPITEGLSTFTALQRQGIPSRFLYFPDESRNIYHWILKHSNSIKWNTEVLRWINQWTFNKKRDREYNGPILVNQQS